MQKKERKVRSELGLVAYIIGVGHKLWLRDL
jgi:hypothetical protein